MKRGITFYIDDDVDMIAFGGTLCTQMKDKSVRDVTMLNLSLEDIKKCAEWYIPVKGKAEPYRPEIQTVAESENKE